MKLSRHSLILAGIIVALVGLAVTAGPYLYRDIIAADALPAPRVDIMETLDTTDLESLNGTWEVSNGSYAGYRVDEVLRGVDVTVVGRTTNLIGQAIIGDSSVNLGTITVDIASIATDQPQRDSYFRSNIAEVRQYPTATFELRTPIDLTAIQNGNTIDLIGDLTLHGVTKEVTIEAQIGHYDDSIEVAGSVPITWSDYTILAPSLGFVTVEKSGSIEFLLHLSRS